MRPVLQLLGGIGVFMAFFFGTLFVVDHVLPDWRNGTRAEQIAAVKQGLAAYYRKHQAYPGPADAPLERLKPLLVDQFMPRFPQDASLRYVSDGKTFYGLVVQIEPDGACLTGVGTDTTHSFADLPTRPCAF